jgi:hypothetical protein
MRPLATYLFWNVERGALAYDLVCALLVLLLILLNPCWLGDPMAVCP